jgi:hypothetical protein
MPRHLWLGLLLTGALLVVSDVSAQTAADKDEAARLARLIDRLGSDDFREREEATRDLDQFGPRALEALRKAAASLDAEVHRRASGLVAAIQRREETKRMLEPKQVHLLFRDTPVPDALDDFARRTGYTLVLAEGRQKLADRKVTLDTGVVPFWEAFDQFCRQAGVVEPALLPPDSHQTDPAVPDVQQQAEMWIGRRTVSYPPQPAAQDTSRLTLVAGKTPVLPTTLAGALRIRVLPAGTPLPGHLPADGDKLLPVEVTPEPGLGWQGVLGLRITRASDDRGRKVTPGAPYVGFTDEGMDYNGAVFLGGMPYGVAPVNESAPRAIPVCLHAGDDSARAIRELHGVVTVQVQTPLQPLLTVDNVLQASGKAVSGEYGGLLKVGTVMRAKNGQVHLRVHLEPPPQEGDVADLMPGGRARRINRALVMWRMAQMAPEMPDLRLLDAKGQPWKRVEEPRQPSGAAAGVVGAQDYEPKFEPGPGQGEPARLVFMGRRTLVLDVPFTLRDVPLGR